MPFTARLACSIAALVAVAGLVRAAHAGDKPPRTLIEAVKVAEGTFTTLAKALGDADLAKLLAGKGPFTLFAPTDEAFAKLPPGTLAALENDKPKLKALLSRHVLTGIHSSKELSGLKSVKPLEGDALRLDAADGLTVDGAKVTLPDVAATNGVMHVIDAVLTGTGAPSAPDSLYALATTTLEGKPLALSEFKGKVTLVVNVASECGFTPQYTALQALHAELAPRGFSVLGFPSNEFGGQEPGDAGEIRTFCETKHHVTFPLFAKVVTKPGEGQSPVYAFLTKGREAPSWNFCKYLVGKDGQVVGFYASAVKPGDADLRKAIEAALK